MTNEEKIRLVLETLGVDNVRQASRAIREMAESVDSLEGEMDQLARSIKDGVEAPMERFLVTLKDGRKVWNDSAEGIKKLGESAGAAAGRRGIRGMSGQDIMTLSYAFDDLQYGMRGIMNNIPHVARAFGLGAGAAGTIGIAVVGLNMAFEALQGILGDTEAKMKPFKEVLDDFAKGMGASNVETQKLTNEIERLSKQAAPGWFEDLTANLPRIREAIQAQKDLIALKKEDQAEAEKRAAFDKRIEEAGKDKDAAAQVAEALDSMGPDGQVGLAKKLAQDKLGKARGELIDEQLAAMEASGNFADIKVPFLGGAMPFLNRGGTSLWKSRAAERAEARRAEAKAKIENDIGFDSEETRKKAESIAGGTIEKARSGDPQAIAEIEAISPEVAGLIKWDAEDKVFQESLRARSTARRNRDESNARREAETQAALAKLGLRRRGDKFADEIAVQQGMASPAKGPAPVSLDAAEAITPDPEREAELARQAAIRNEVLAQMDPTQMAAMRNAEAGMGPFRNRNLKQLEQRDLELFANALAERGMAPGDAQQAATESLTGGRAAFQEFANSVGKNLENGLRAQEASVMFFNMMRTRMDEFAVRQEMLMQQLNILGNQQPNVRPQMGRARN